MIEPVWYDLFALVYDRALDDLYAPFRPAAVEALRLSDGAGVLERYISNSADSITIIGEMLRGETWVTLSRTHLARRH